MDATHVLARAAQDNPRVRARLDELGARAAAASTRDDATTRDPDAALRPRAAPAPTGAADDSRATLGSAPPAHAGPTAHEPPEPPARSRRRWPWVVALALLVALGVAMAVVGLGTFSSAPPAAETATEPFPEDAPDTMKGISKPAEPSLLRYQAWPMLGALLAGIVLVLFAVRAARRPLAALDPPDASSDDPLRELHSLTTRMRARMTTTFRLQVAFVVGVAVLLVAILGWSVVLVTLGEVGFGAIFGSGGVGLTVLSQWKWQPFERIQMARNEANDADLAAFAIQSRIVALQQIPDPVERSRAQWQAISEYLQLVSAKPQAMPMPAASPA